MEFDAPMYYDFERFQEGLAEDQDCDKWFDGKSESDQETISPKCVVPSDPVAETKNKHSEIWNLLLEKNKAKGNKIKLKKNIPSRNAALKATKSITAMYKPKPSTSTNNRKINEEISSVSSISSNNLQRKAIGDNSVESLKRPMASSKPCNVRVKNTPRDANTKHCGTSTKKNVFPMNLRSSDGNKSNPATPRNVTNVKPFKFLTEDRLQQRKRHRSGDGSFVSTAEFIEKFQRTTPPRFRTKIPNDIGNNLPSGKICVSKDLTIPKSPKLRTRYRSRPVTAISREELEERAMDDMKSHPFKATPLDPKIFQTDSIGVRKPTTRPTTRPVSPHISKPRSTCKRTREDLNIEEEKNKFKAKPMPHTIFAKVTGVPEKQLLELTAPCSPQLSKRRRILNDTTMSEVPVSTSIKTIPIPDFSKVFTPSFNHSQTEVQPFTFDHKYPAKGDALKKLIAKNEEEAAKKRDFHANPLPDFECSSRLPPKILLPNTEPKPFGLSVEKRVAEHLKKFQDKVNMKQEEEIAKHVFHATDIKAHLHSKPLEPTKSIKPLTETSNIVLHTALRSQDRMKFDDDKKKRNEERFAAEEKRKQLEKIKEEEKIKVLRRSLVHKAVPIPDYPLIKNKKSTKPLTEPRSPIVHYKTRSVKQIDN